MGGLGERRWFLPAVVLVAAGAGFLLGRGASATEHVGDAVAAEGAIAVEADGWTYGVPTDIAWIDEEGTRHDSGRPACLMPSGTPVRVRFWSVDAAIGAFTWKPVVLVDCRASLAANG